MKKQNKMYKYLEKQIEELEYKLNTLKAITKNLQLYKKEPKKQLNLHVVSRQLKGLFFKGDEAIFCGYDVTVSYVDKKWAIVTDCNDHHYNARIKDLRPRNF